MNYSAWHLEADRLHKAVEYAACGPVRTRLMNLLHVHLEIKPTIDAEPTTPLPEITEPSTVEKFGDGWIEWNLGRAPDGLSRERKVHLKLVCGYVHPLITVKNVDWKNHGNKNDIIAYRVVKD